MDILKTVREIGFFELSSNLAKVIHSSEIQENVGGFMPLPDIESEKKISMATSWLRQTSKDKFLFLTPEIALIDMLAEDTSENKEAIIIIPCDMDSEVKERLRENLPKSMKTSLLEEPFFPADFYPSNGILIVCGYLTGNRCMVLPETYRMIEHYSGFWGKKVFIPYCSLEDAKQYDEWLEAGQEQFKIIWRDDE